MDGNRGGNAQRHSVLIEDRIISVELHRGMHSNSHTELDTPEMSNGSSTNYSNRP